MNVAPIWPVRAPKLTRRRLTAIAGALITGGIAGVLTVATGGSIGRAPYALAVLCACVGVVTLCGGAVAGARADAVGTVVVAASFIVGFYAATWLRSPYHRAIGDAMTMIIASIPAAIGAPLGYLLGTTFIPPHQ